MGATPRRVLARAVSVLRVGPSTSTLGIAVRAHAARGLQLQSRAPRRCASSRPRRTPPRAPGTRRARRRRRRPSPGRRRRRGTRSTRTPRSRSPTDRPGPPTRSSRTRRRRRRGLQGQAGQTAGGVDRPQGGQDPLALVGSEGSTGGLGIREHSEVTEVAVRVPPGRHTRSGHTGRGKRSVGLRGELGGRGLRLVEESHTRHRGPRRDRGKGPRRDRPGTRGATYLDLSLIHI